MQEKKTLLLVNNFNDFIDRKNYFSFIPIDKNFKKYKNIKILEYDFPTRNEISSQYDFCINLFNEILGKLTNKLNLIHKVNFSKREWDIIIGYWLNDYIYKCYKIYIQFKYVIKKYNIQHAHLTNHKEYDFTTSDTFEFLTIESDNIDWYLSFCSKIFDYFQFTNKAKNYHSSKFFRTKFKISKGRKITKILNKTTNSINKVLKINDNAFIAGTSLPFYEEKKLQFHFNKFPYFYNFKNIKDEKYNLKLRESISFKVDKSKKTIENFILENINIFLPKSFLENFQKIKNIANSNIFPKNPKFIFTSYLHAFDENFKTYAAFKTRDKKPYYVSQHGNNCFTRIHNNHSREFYYTDKFFSWGYKDNHKIDKLFNFKTLKKLKNNKQGNFLIVFDFIRNIPDTLYLTPNSIMENILRSKKFIKNLDPKIQSKIILRLNSDFFAKVYGIKYFELFNDLNVKIDKGGTNMENLIEESRIVLFTYDSTNFLENYVHDIPSIIFCNPNYLNSIDKKFYPRYLDLQRNKVMFTNVEEISNHINLIWNDPKKWWVSKETKQCLENFNKDLNTKPYKGCFDDLISKLKY